MIEIAFRHGLLKFWPVEKRPRERREKSTADGKGKAPPPVGRMWLVELRVLRGIENDQAIAPFQIVKEINAGRDVGVCRHTVRLV